MLPQVWTFRFLEIDEDGNARDIPEDERVKIGGAKSTITRSEEILHDHHHTRPPTRRLHRLVGPIQRSFRLPKRHGVC